jgi:hypothetical protein
MTISLGKFIRLDWKSLPKNNLITSSFGGILIPKPEERKTFTALQTQPNNTS